MSNIAELQRAARGLQPITLPLARKLMIAFAVFLAAFLVMTILAVVPKNPIFGTVSIVFWVLLLWLSLRMLQPGGTFLEFDIKELTQSFGICKSTLRWAEVRQIRIGWYEFEAVEIPWNRKVFVDYERNGWKTFIAISPPMFGVNAEQLVSLLTPYYQHEQREQIAMSRAATAPEPATAA
jgi:hypothetical protein